jgi:hypothetical protein
LQTLENFNNYQRKYSGKNSEIWIIFFYLI